MSEWKSTNHANIVRAPSGMYHMRAKVNGKRYRMSLKTDVLLLAIKRRDEELQRLRERPQTAQNGRWTGADAIEAYQLSLESKGLRKRSLDYRKETIKMLRSTWPKFPEVMIDRVSRMDVMQWAKEASGRYSPTRFNGMLETLRGIFGIAVGVGMATRNPATEVQRKRIQIKAPELPERSDYERVLTKLNTTNRKPAWLAVQILETTGLRLCEAQNLLKRDVDLKRNMLRARETKGGQPRSVPLIKAARDLFAEHLKYIKADDPVMPVANPKVSLYRACREAGVAPLSPHKLRHLFATRCIESGVDIRTVAEWLGHKDHGVTLLKRYAHLRNEHHQKMANLVS